HACVIELFDPRRNPGAALAVCTQVAEMSLDLSATMLVTDRAPVPALIQRLGRLNRRARPAPEGEPPPPPMPFLVVEPCDREGKLSMAPYTPEEIAPAGPWLDALGYGPLSQATLSEK